MSQTQASHEPSPDDHDDPAGHDDHGHGEAALGPVDIQAWGALAIGVAAGLLVALCLVISITLLAPAGA